MARAPARRMIRAVASRYADGLPAVTGGYSDAGMIPASDAPHSVVKNCSASPMTSAARSPGRNPASRSARATPSDTSRRSAKERRVSMPSATKT